MFTLLVGNNSEACLMFGTDGWYSKTYFVINGKKRKF